MLIKQRTLNVINKNNKSMTLKDTVRLVDTPIYTSWNIKYLHIELKILKIYISVHISKNIHLHCKINN